MPTHSLQRRSQRQAIYGKLAFSAGARERVYAMHAAGELRALVDARPFRGLEEVVPAVAHMLSGQTIGKVVVQVGAGGA